MPLHLGKAGAVIALLTIAAFLLWLMFGAFFEGESVEEEEGATLRGEAAFAASCVFGFPPPAGQEEERIRPETA